LKIYFQKVDESKNRQALAWVSFYDCPGLLYGDARSESLFGMKRLMNQKTDKR
jgi:hypothetical protein